MKRGQFRIRILTFFLALSVLFSCSLTSVAATLPDQKTLLKEAEERKEIKPESNGIQNWPQGPLVSADAAILMDADTGAILYEKNIHAKEYPASTTKLMTALLAVENCNLNDEVYFSKTACNIPWDASNMGIKADSTITLEQALFGLLVASANEAATAIGEHISGDSKAFAELMNTRAGELGCLGTHFVNANGLFDEEHYTTAYDLALIARAFFSHEILQLMSSTTEYHIEASEKQPDNLDIYSHNNLYAGKEYEYENLVGSKTGYTNVARNTLVSAARRNGMTLICVVLKEEAPSQYTDTTALFDYGFSNFERVKVCEAEKKYSFEEKDSFHTEKDLFGSSKPILYLDPKGEVTLPATTFFEDIECNSVSGENDDTVATLFYSYHGVDLGKCDILINREQVRTMDFHSIAEGESLFGARNEIPEEEDAPRVIYVNVKLIILIVIGVAILLVIISYIISYLRSSRHAIRKGDRKRRRRRKKDYTFRSTEAGSGQARFSNRRTYKRSRK